MMDFKPTRRVFLFGIGSLVALPRKLAAIEPADDEIPVLGDAIEIALHSAQPSLPLPFATEARYPGYRRARLPAREWFETSERGPVLAKELVFPMCVGGFHKATHFSVGQRGLILVYGELSAPIFLMSGVSPVFPAGGLVIEAAALRK